MLFFFNLRVPLRVTCVSLCVSLLRLLSHAQIEAIITNTYIQVVNHFYSF